MGKTDEILAEVKSLKRGLYGENGFDGDIPEMKSDIKELSTYLNGHADRIIRIETRQEERTKPSKKTIGGYSAGIIAVGLAVWKSFFG